MMTFLTIVAVYLGIGFILSTFLFFALGPKRFDGWIILAWATTIVVWIVPAGVWLYFAYRYWRAK